jgi:hypothetical protein
MSVFNEVGCKDTDMLIMLHVNNFDLFNLFQVCTKINTLMNTDSFWKMKIRHEYGDSFLLKNRTNISSWKDYFVSLTLPLQSDFPFYEAAIALHNERHDIVSLIQKKLKMKSEPIISVINETKEKFQKYYLRTDGSEYFEGVNIEIIHGQGKAERIYKNGYLESSKMTFNNGKIEEYKYNHGLIKQKKKWNKHGTLLSQEQNNGKTRRVKKWYANTEKPRCEGTYINSKKDGIWKTWNESGQLKETVFEKGKKLMVLNKSNLEAFLKNIPNI